MACRLLGLKPYLNRCRLILNWTLSNFNWIKIKQFLYDECISNVWNSGQFVFAPICQYDMIICLPRQSSDFFPPFTSCNSAMAIFQCNYSILGVRENKTSSWPSYSVEKLSFCSNSTYHSGGATSYRGYPAKRALPDMLTHGRQGPFGRIPSLYGW